MEKKLSKNNQLKFFFSKQTFLLKKIAEKEIEKKLVEIKFHTIELPFPYQVVPVLQWAFSDAFFFTNTSPSMNSMSQVFKFIKLQLVHRYQDNTGVST